MRPKIIKNLRAELNLAAQRHIPSHDVKKFLPPGNIQLELFNYVLIKHGLELRNCAVSQ